MGADSWTVCPRCRKKAIDAKQAATEEASLAYGLVPPEAWDALRQKAEAMPDGKTMDYDEEYWRLAEYHEFVYSYELNTLGMTYSAECRDCGWSLTLPEQNVPYEVKP